MPPKTWTHRCRKEHSKLAVIDYEAFGVVKYYFLTEGRTGIAHLTITAFNEKYELIPESE